MRLSAKRLSNEPDCKCESLQSSEVDIDIHFVSGIFKSRSRAHTQRIPHSIGAASCPRQLKDLISIEPIHQNEDRSSQV